LFPEVIFILPAPVVGSTFAYKASLAAQFADADDGIAGGPTRNDGGRQWAFKGKPLYLWIKDHKPGDMTGDGFKGVWHVVPQ
jgi:predicted lipoprotein with Yx(FWY)xxD motif